MDAGSVKTAGRKNNVTNMQFKSILLLVYEILKRAKNIDDAIEAIDEVLMNE